MDLNNLDTVLIPSFFPQIELVLKFLQKAALSLREPYFLKAPSVKLSGKDRAAIVAKELNEFLSHYRRETELFTVFKEEAGMVSMLYSHIYCQDFPILYVVVN